MPINFPDSPTNGQEFTSGATTWTYNGTAWDLKTTTTASNDSMPVGSIMWFAGTTAPTGWVLCNGATYTNSTYPNLVAVIGTTFGGTPGTNFMVPNISATTGAYYIRFTTAVGVTSTLSLLSAPVGSMVQWPVTSSYPTGWLRCDGANISRTSYADLFALIGTTYGSGDGSSTFTLPNISAAGSGSPVYIIKATTSGLVEPSSVAHAASHVRGGTDIIDADRAQIDYVPSYYTRNSGASEAGAVTDLTAHLSGIDSKLGQYIIGSTAPSSPTIGWLWFDTVNGLLRIWNGVTWRPFVATTAATGASSYTGTPLQVAKHRWTNETVASSATYIDATGSSYTFKPLYASSRLEVVAELAMAPYYPGSSYAGMACRVLRDGTVLTYQNQTHQVYLSSGIDLYTRTVMSWQGAANNINNTTFKIQLASYAATNTARINQAGNWESFITITEWAI